MSDQVSPPAASDPSSTAPADAPEKSGLRKHAMTFVRVAVSLALVVYLLNVVDWPKFWQAAQNADYALLAAAPVVTLVAILFAGGRWVVLLGARGRDMPYKAALYLYTVAGFYNVVLPGAISGDVVRIAGASKVSGGSIADHSAVVLIERATGLLAVFMLGVIGVLWIPGSMRDALGPWLVLGVPAMAVILTGGLLISRAIVKTYGDTMLGWTTHLGPLAGPAATILGFVRNTLVVPVSALGKSVFLTLFYQFADAAMVALLAAAFGTDVSVALIMVANPAVFVATVLPLSLGGLGVREGVMAGILGLVGIPESEAVALSFMVYINRVVVGLVGGALHLALPLDKLAAQRASENGPAS